MADTLEKQAISGAAQEGRMAGLQGLGVDCCPYPNIAGLLSDQRTAWINAWKGAGNAS